MTIPKTTIVVMALSALTIVACAAGMRLTREKIQDPGQLLFNGYQNPQVNCFNCHNGDGRGSGRGPDLAPKVVKLDDAAILIVIEKGKSFMPSFGEKTTPEERQEIVTWLRQAFGGPQAKAPVPVEAEPAEKPAQK
jgi:mono/diheme cytochrome c family protein